MKCQNAVTAINRGWVEVRFPLSLLHNPLIDERNPVIFNPYYLPEQRLAFMLLTPDWGAMYKDQPQILGPEDFALSDRSIWCANENAPLIRDRIKYLKMELELLSPVHLYLEAHVTIEPVFDELRESAGLIAKSYNFKLAHLLMKKQRKETEQRSDKDTFMTGHDTNYRNLACRTIGLVRDLREAGFKVWRYKIENTICDSRNNNIFGLDLDVDRFNFGLTTQNESPEVVKVGSVPGKDDR